MTSLFHRPSLLSLVYLLLVAAGPALAQPPTGVLVGTIRDSQRGVLPGVTVVVVHEVSGVRTQTITRSEGQYAVSGLRPGSYRVSVSLSGFREGEAVVTLAAGEERRDFVLEVAEIREELTVRAGTSLARDQKRAAASITDIVSADAVGRFPDTNAAEALRRIPGVSMEIDQGEGRFVVVRGLDATLNNVTLNGQIVGTPAEFGTRGVSMDSVPADMISRLEVAKAMTPDMDANAIGGRINIATLGAFDRPAGLLSGTLRGGYNKLSGRRPFSANLSYSRTLSPGWGLSVGGSFSQRRFDSELFRVSSGAWSSFNGFLVPQNQAFFLYDVDRRRQGVNVALGHRPADGQEITLRLNHNLFRDIEQRQQVEFDLTRGTLSNQTPTSGRFSQGRASREFRDYEQEHTINAVALNGTHVLDRWLAEWRAGFSRGQRDTPNRVDWEFRSAGNAFPNTYDTSDSTAPLVTPSANFYDPAAYPFRRVRFRQDLEREDVMTGEVSLRRDISVAERRAYWKAGAKFVGRDKTQDRTNQNYTGAGFTLASFGLGSQGPTDFYEGHAPFGPTLNLAALKEFFAASPGFFTFDALTTQVDSVTQDFQADEQVTAGFLMGQIDFERWNLLAGARVERTTGNYHANELVYRSGAFSGVVRPATGETSYTDVLPGMHVNFFPRRNLTVRLAWTNTLGRPAYSQLAPIRVLDEILNENGTYIGSLSSGNANLKPYESMNLDASIEYYLGSGLISVAPFYKRIDNPIYGLSYFENDITYNDRLYERLSFSEPTNADAGRIAGVEFSYQDYFSSLPSFWSGFGVNLNYTRTASSVTLFTRTDELPFFKQSDHIGNVAALFEKYGVSAQVSMSFSSPTLEGVGANPAGDSYDDWYKVWDIKVSAPLRGGIRGLLELSNVNDQHRVSYAGNPDLRTADERYSWNLFVGVDWRIR